MEIKNIATELYERINITKKNWEIVIPIIDMPSILVISTDV